MLEPAEIVGFICYVGEIEILVKKYNNGKIKIKKQHIKEYKHINTKCVHKINCRQTKFEDFWQKWANKALTAY